MVTALTGASGHIGANLVRALLQRGESVRVLVHQQSHSLQGLDVESVEGSLDNPAALAKLAEGATTLYHLAARICLTPAEEAMVHQVNVSGTANVLEACQRAKVGRLVHFSSIHAFSPKPHALPINEDRPLASGTRTPTYDRSKAAGEALVRAAMADGMNAVIVNPTAVLGPYDYGPSAMGSILLSLYHGRLPALVTGGFNWVDVRDVVHGAMAAAKTGKAGRSYLLTGHYAPVWDLAKVVQQVTGRRAPRWLVPLWLAHVGVPAAQLHAKITRKPFLWTHDSLRALRNHRSISCARATQELGYNARPLHETLDAAFQWYGDNGLLGAAA